MLINMLRNSSKNHGGDTSVRVWDKTPSSANLNFYCCYDYYVSSSAIRLVVKFWHMKVMLGEFLLLFLLKFSVIIICFILC